MGDAALFLGRGGYLDTDHLTTHAVCVGMTGSGKTGLGIVALEELARRGVPLLVIDLKGDMINLLLNFPGLRGEDFLPWLPADSIVGRDPVAVAGEQAALWKEGLAGCDLGSAEIQQVRDGLKWQLITPGVSLAPLDILPALSLPEGWDLTKDPDAINDRVNGLVSALLSLIGRGGDPLTDRDHVLLASIILEHWRRGDKIDLVRLLSSLAEPPMANLGALPIEVFYDRGDRMKLVMELNTLVASPAFAAWTRGTPLDMEVLLGKPGAGIGTIVSIAHLDERQRHFVLALLLSEFVAWMRRQPASSGLRALLYMDEVQGILPPHPANPPTKAPLMTLLKQGRAFGVGAWLATQNPVDLDYKALGNAGIKIVGRLITDRDRSRALEGLGVDHIEGRDADELVAGLAKREFVLYDVRAAKRLAIFSSRWAMSYLRGPVTLHEMAPLLAGQAVRREVDSAVAPVPRTPAVCSAPLLTSGVSQRFADGVGGLVRPELHLRCTLIVERTTLDLYQKREECWKIPVADDGGLDYEAASVIERDEIDLVDEPPEGMVFPKAVSSAFDQELKTIERSFVAWRARRPILVVAHETLKISAHDGENREDFCNRCLKLADRADDQRQERVRQRFERQITNLKKRLARERDELERDETQLDSRKAEEKLGVVEGLFAVLLGSRSLRSAAGKAATKARSAASKRRIRQTAEASVVESQREIERLADEIEDLAGAMQEEVDAIAAESEALAESIEEVPVKINQANIELVHFEVVWR